MKKHILSRSALPVLLIVLATSVLQADTFTVTRTNNTGPGSLPVVISQANATPGDQTIEFAVTGTITLVSPLPTITNNLTINGRVDNPLVISGGGSVPMFSFAPGTTNFLNYLNLANGKTTNGGAAINNAGTLFVTGSLFTNNTAQKGSGGAISNAGTMTIVSSILCGNQAAMGGAILNSGGMTITDSKLLNNQAGNGGAIYNVGLLTIERLTISSNQASMLGGGICNYGHLTAFCSIFATNRVIGSPGENGLPGRDYGDSYAKSGGGGGGGGAGALGGGLFTSSGIANLTNCTFSDNLAVGGIGGNGGQVQHIEPFNEMGRGGNGGGTGAGLGGIASSYSKNKGGMGGIGAGGGGGAGGLSGISSSSGSGGNGGFGAGNGGHGGEYIKQGWGGDGGSGMGAGIFIDNNGSLTLVNCTVTANAALGGAGGITQPTGVETDGAGVGIGGGIFNRSGTVGLLNTIVASNSTTNGSPDLNGAFTSSGFNLIGNNQGATGLSVNDYQNEDAKIGPLQDNGGPTLTHALLQGSLAIGGGTSVDAPDTDQRGVPRPAGHCDIGAFQLGTILTATIIWNNPSDIVYGTALGSNQLNAAVGVDGTFSYSPPAGTVLPAADNQVLTVVFTPANMAQYAVATNTVTINVLKANQTISFASLPNRQIGDSPGLLSGSASSGLPVSFSIVAGPATLTANLLVLGSASGLVTVRATQLGDANFNAAPYVDRSFVLGTLPLPVLVQQPVSQVANPGDRITFTVGANNGPFTYQWRFNGQPIPGAIGDTLVLARVKASQAGPYDVIVSNPSGPIISQVAVLTVNIVTGSPIIITQPQDQKLRVGENTTISVVANGATPNLFYQWYQGASGETGGLIMGATNASYTVLGLTATTRLWVNVRNSLGFADSDSAAITVFPAKAAKLRLQMFAGMPGLTIDGLQGTAYRIEYSTNQSAMTWTKLIDLSLPSNPFTFYDSGAVNTSTRFYRVVAP